MSERHLVETIVISGIEVKLYVIHSECDTPYRGNALASGDDAVDRKAEQVIREKLEAGLEWAWCDLEVRAEAQDGALAGSDFLGCCSYDDLQHFESDGYFHDMKVNAIAELKMKARSLKHLVEALAK